MKKIRAVALFSGGKDSMYSIQVASLKYEIVSLFLITTTNGDMQLTDGPEIKNKIIYDLISALPFPYDEISINTSTDYLDQLASTIKNRMSKYQAQLLITGDLEHPDGIDKVLVKKIGIQTYSAAQEFIKNNGPEAYIKDVFKKGIKPIISGVRNQNLPITFVGKKFNQSTVTEIKKMNIDITGEDGEFQTLVCDAPLMTKKIKINNFDLEKTLGRDTKNYTYTRMVNINYSLRKKREKF